MKRFFLMAIAAATVCGSRAELPPLIPREVLFGNPEKISPQISPDGNFLAYLAPTNGALNVWVRGGGLTNDIVVTADRHRGIRTFLWQPDSQRILYMQDRNGDENWHLYQANLLTANIRDLTPFEGVQARIVALDVRFPKEMLVSLNLRDRRFHDVFRVDLRNGAVVPDTDNTGDVVDWSVDNALEVRGAKAYLPDGGTDIRIRSDSRSIWRSFQKWSPDETFGGIAGFATNNAAMWIISSVGANTARLLECDAATGLSRVVAEDKQFDVAGVQIHPTTGKLEAVEFHRARLEWQVLDDDIRADFEALRILRDGDFRVVSRDLADKTWIVSYVLDDAPVSFYAYNRPTKKAEFLFSSRPILERYRLARMKVVNFKARDGLNLQGYLTLPIGLEDKNLPTVLMVHGGPWSRDTWGNNNYVQWLANRGYAVLQVNFRGSTGYGKSFLNAGDREWGARMHDDLIDAKNWIVQQGTADPKRVGIFGGSYGGYAVLAALTFTPDEFACGVDLVGPSNLQTLIESIPPYWAPMKAMFDKRLGKVETDAEFLKSRSPLFKADQIKKPLLIGQGANDPRVKQAESDQIVAAMRKNGLPVDYIVFPDEGHGFQRPENNMKFMAAAEAFLAKHLGGRVEAAATAEKWDDLLK